MRSGLRRADPRPTARGISRSTRTLWAGRSVPGTRPCAGSRSRARRVGGCTPFASRALWLPRPPPYPPPPSPFPLPPRQPSHEPDHRKSRKQVSIRYTHGSGRERLSPEPRAPERQTIGSLEWPAARVERHAPPPGRGGGGGDRTGISPALSSSVLSKPQRLGFGLDPCVVDAPRGRESGVAAVGWAAPLGVKGGMV